MHRRRALDFLGGDDADVGPLLLDDVVLEKPDERIQIGRALR